MTHPREESTAPGRWDNIRVLTVVLREATEMYTAVNTAVMKIMKTGMRRMVISPELFCRMDDGIMRMIRFPKSRTAAEAAMRKIKKTVDTIERMRRRKNPSISEAE